MQDTLRAANQHIPDLGLSAEQPLAMFSYLNRYRYSSRNVELGIAHWSYGLRNMNVFKLQVYPYVCMTSVLLINTFSGLI